MTPSEEAVGRVTVPLNVTVSVFSIVDWISKLDMVIAIELDAGRSAVAKQISQVRDELAERANLTRLLEEAPR